MPGSRAPDKRPLANAVRVVQFTDLHLLGDPAARLRGVDTERTFHAVCDAARRDLDDADLLLLTGDLAELGEAAAYTRLRTHLEALGIDERMRAIPGNHDDPVRLAATFDSTGKTRVAAHALDGWQLLLLDSSVPGRSAGLLEASQLDWLDARLTSATGSHVLLVLHHPPLPIGSAWLDAIALENGRQLLRLCDAHANLRGVLFGHVHQAFEQRRRGVRHFATPSTCMQFVPRSARVVIDAAGPGWRTLELHPDGRIRTRVKRVVAPQAAARPRSA